MKVETIFCWDLLLNDLAEEAGLSRHAFSPVQAQHIGNHDFRSDILEVDGERRGTSCMEHGVRGPRPIGS
jgi:hypothetical protein